MNEIKYDLSDVKLYSKIARISFLVLLADLVFVYLSTFSSLRRYFSDMHFVLAAIILYPSMVFCIFYVIKIIVATDYLKQLERAGYILPVDKKDYDGVVENLDTAEQSQGRNAQDLQEEKKQKPINCSGRLLSGVCVFVFLVCAFLNILFYRKYRIIGESAQGTLGIKFFCDAIWIIMAIVLFIQSDNTRYKELGDTDQGKKIRLSAGKSTLLMIVLLIGTCIVKAVTTQMSDYIFRTMVYNNEEIRRMTQGALEEAYECQQRIDSDTLLMLEEGTNILEWDDSTEFRKMVLERMPSESYESLRENIELAKGEPEMYVRFVDDEFEVQLLNVYTLVDLD